MEIESLYGIKMRNRIPRIHLYQEKMTLLTPESGFHIEQVGKYIVEFPILEQFHVRQNYPSELRTKEEVLKRVKRDAVFELISQANEKFPGKMFKITSQYQESYSKFHQDILLAMKTPFSDSRFLAIWKNSLVVRCSGVE